MGPVAGEAAGAVPHGHFMYSMSAVGFDSTDESARLASIGRELVEGQQVLCGSMAKLYCTAPQPIACKEACLAMAIGRITGDGMPKELEAFSEPALDCSAFSAVAAMAVAAAMDVDGGDEEEEAEEAQGEEGQEAAAVAVAEGKSHGMEEQQQHQGGEGSTRTDKVLAHGDPQAPTDTSTPGTTEPGGGSAAHSLGVAEEASPMVPPPLPPCACPAGPSCLCAVLSRRPWQWLTSEGDLDMPEQDMGSCDTQGLCLRACVPCMACSTPAAACSSEVHCGSRRCSAEQKQLCGGSKQAAPCMSMQQAEAAWSTPGPEGPLGVVGTLAFGPPRPSAPSHAPGAALPDAIIVDAHGAGAALHGQQQPVPVERQEGRQQQQEQALPQQQQQPQPKQVGVRFLALPQPACHAQDGDCAVRSAFSSAFMSGVHAHGFHAAEEPTNRDKTGSFLIPHDLLKPPRASTSSKPHSSRPASSLSLLSSPCGSGSHTISSLLLGGASASGGAAGPGAGAVTGGGCGVGQLHRQPFSCSFKQVLPALAATPSLQLPLAYSPPTQQGPPSGGPALFATFSDWAQHSNIVCSDAQVGGSALSEALLQLALQSNGGPSRAATPHPQEGEQHEQQQLVQQQQQPGLLRLDATVLLTDPAEPQAPPSPVDGLTLVAMEVRPGEAPLADLLASGCLHRWLRQQAAGACASSMGAHSAYLHTPDGYLVQAMSCVASALSALHAQGIAHGAVHAGSVVLLPLGDEVHAQDVEGSSCSVAEPPSWHVSAGQAGRNIPHSDVVARLQCMGDAMLQAAVMPQAQRMGVKSVAHVAPELHAGGQPSRESDLYGFGILMW